MVGVAEYSFFMGVQQYSQDHWDLKQGWERLQADGVLNNGVDIRCSQPQIKRSYFFPSVLHHRFAYGAATWAQAKSGFRHQNATRSFQTKLWV